MNIVNLKQLLICLKKNVMIIKINFRWAYNT